MSFLSSPWNHAVPHLEMRYGDHVLASGSCFFWKVADQTFLVSNWHNFSGRDPATLAPISPTCGRPDRIAFTTFKKVSEVDEDGIYEMTIGHATVSLYQDNMEEAKWLEHPQLGRLVDVAAIDVTTAVEGLLVKYANELEDDAILEPLPSQDVFIIGYPLGQITGAPGPIWKRGTIATDPTFHPDGLPKIYVDTATRSGMSGSVVIVRHNLFGKRIKKKDGTLSEPMIYAKRDLVLGIYSGRLGADHVQAQLGIVWKRQVIEETITGMALARRDYDLAPSF